MTLLCEGKNWEVCEACQAEYPIRPEQDKADNQLH